MGRARFRVRERNERSGTMGLELYMVGLTVRDMDQAVTFYRRLGLEVPEAGVGQSHV